MTVQIVSVLRSGGDFNPGHFFDLRSSIKRTNPTALDPILLTDCAIPGNALVHDWPGWWSKFEVFALPGNVLFLDLDTVVCGDLSPLLNFIEFELPPRVLLMLEDFYRPGRAASGIMGWNSGALGFPFYEKFLGMDINGGRFSLPMGGKEQFTPGRTSKVFRGDQNLIPEIARSVGWEIYQARPGDKFGIYSYKKHVLSQSKHAIGPPPGAAVVCFHGQPRPWDVDPLPDWIREAWGRLPLGEV